jgi:tRNA dimethylallyltransferase
VYKGMQILTGILQPPAGIVQHLVNFVEPTETYSVKTFKHDAEAIIAEIHEHKALPILVGGTALYIDAVLDNWQMPSVSPDPVLRLELQEIYAREGLGALVRRLSKKDPAALTVVDVVNPRRIMRALEVAYSLGNWSAVAREKSTPKYNVLRIGITIDRVELRRKIAARVSEMFAAGVVEETKSLLLRYPSASTVMTSIGCDALIAHIHGIMTREECEEKIVTKSYQYARRQMTWWKKDKRIQWTSSEESAIALVRKFLS